MAKVFTSMNIFGRKIKLLRSRTCQNSRPSSSRSSCKKNVCWRKSCYSIRWLSVYLLVRRMFESIWNQFMTKKNLESSMQINIAKAKKYVSCWDLRITFCEPSVVRVSTFFAQLASVLEITSLGLHILTRRASWSRFLRMRMRAPRDSRTLSTVPGFERKYA